MAKKTILIFIFFWIICYKGNTQVSPLKSVESDYLTFNSIDTIQKNIWVVEYEFWNLIDTVMYVEDENIGYVIGHDRKGGFKYKDTYYNKELGYPILGYYTSDIKILLEDETYLYKSYEGRNVRFSDDFLIKRELFYKNGLIKEVQEFKYEKTKCTVITFDNITREKIANTYDCFDKVKNGIWKWYDVHGDIIKEEDNR